MRTFPILQVEDTQNDILLMQHAFREVGITNPLYSVRDGQEAMDYLAGIGKFADRHQYPLPCLVLLDLKLPGRMGLEVLQWIREQDEFRSLLVIVLTSSGQAGDIDSAYRSGANAFLIKPSGFNELIELLQALKMFWIRFNQIPSECFESRVG